MISRSALRTPRLLLALSSAVLLIISFPNFNQPWCAWVALVPWLILLRSCSTRDAFRWSWLIGFGFFLGSIWWLVYVTMVGWIVLCAYLAIYFGIFGWLVHRRVVLGQGTGDKRQVSRLPSPVSNLLAIPSLWVALECARSHLLSGFGWNLLAYSQTPWREVTQVADVTGAWGVSFLVVMVNVAIAELIRRALASGEGRGARERSSTQRTVASALTVLGTVLGVLSYGAWRLSHLPMGAPIKIAVVQGNIPQAEKWDAAYLERIQARYAALTQRAATTTPDLIVWPETSVPGYFGVDEALTQWVGGIARAAHSPLLVGAPMPAIERDRAVLHNSAALIDAAGVIREQHHKLHLVPLGEFIPFERVAPWLRHVLPPIGDFVPGHAYTVFRLGSEPHELERGVRGTGQGVSENPPLLVSRPLPPFSVLICFEDVVPELARRFVREGARLLLVVTNDAWFGPTAAAYQHVQASTFRAIELRVPIARAANTGWSGCIDPFGRWCGSVRDAKGTELFVAGTHTCDVVSGAARSLYRSWGDWFAWVCCVALMMAIGNSWPLNYHTPRHLRVSRDRLDLDDALPDWV